MTDLSELARHRTVLDDETRHVARVYAEALYRVAEQENLTDYLLEELDALVNGVFGQDPGLELFFASAAVGTGRKAEAIRAAFEGRASHVLINFLLALNENGRLDKIRAIADAYRALHERKQRHLRVTVRSAVALTDEERERLREDIVAVTAGMRPIFEEKIEPELLGGLIVQAGDWVYDASLRTRLLTIRNQVIERSSHGYST